MRQKSASRRNRYRVDAALLVLVVAFSFQASAASTDSTLIRKTSETQKSLGHKILKAPQLIINAPILLLKGSGKFLVNDIFDSRRARRFYNLVGGLKRIWGFYPVAGYAANPGFKGGIAFRSRGVFTVEERLKVKLSYSTHDYQSYSVRYIAPSILRSNQGITCLFHYGKSPWESFCGLGHDSRKMDEMSFCSEETCLRAGGLWGFIPNAAVEITSSYRMANLYDGQDPNFEGDLDAIRDSLNLSALDTRSSRIWSVRAALTHDWRNSVGQPSRGGVEILSFSYHQGVNRSDDLQYTIGRIDLRHYLNIYKKRIFALRVMAQSIDTREDSPDIPFYLRSALGGGESLRGYRSGRFVDNDMALLTLEYRYPIWDIVDAFVFLDEGRVFNAILDDFSLRNWRHSVGGGIRIWNPEETLMSLMVAASDEETRFYFQFSDTF